MILASSYENFNGMKNLQFEGMIADSLLENLNETALKVKIEYEEQDESPPIERTTGILLPKENQKKSCEENLTLTELHYKKSNGKQFIFTESYYKVKLKQSLSKALDNLKKFQESFDMAEAPMYIHIVKKTLNDSWEFITDKDMVISLILPALEGALRQTKWRNYSHHQISIIQNILEECINEKICDRKDALRKISQLYKEDIDIFPSAPEEAYGDD